MKKNNTLTVAISYKSKDCPLVKSIMENIMSFECPEPTTVYAAAHEDLFAKIERIEDIILEDDCTSEDKIDLIKEILSDS